MFWEIPKTFHEMWRKLYLKFYKLKIDTRMLFYENNSEKILGNKSSYFLNINAQFFESMLQVKDRNCSNVLFIYTFIHLVLLTVSRDFRTAAMELRKQECTPTHVQHVYKENIYM